ncbi:response regulator [Tumebacillus flagellatus]|nr:response regulator [Tumebacillus flagellatus]
MDLQVLIVEDDPKVAEVNRRFVEKIPGYRVVGVATDRVQAQEQLEILQPDLVLLDIYFPDMNGLDLLRWMQEEHPETDVIAITAAKEVDTVREAMRGGAFDYLVKPLVFDRFQRSLQHYKDYRRRLQQLQAERPRIEQEEIDRLLHGAAANPVAKDTQLPKGIDKLTLEKVLAALDDTGWSADEIGRKIGASRSTARRYLEYLVAQGEARAELSYGVVGRPERVYRPVK